MYIKKCVQLTFCLTLLFTTQNIKSLGFEIPAVNEWLLRTRLPLLHCLVTAEDKDFIEAKKNLDKIKPEYQDVKNQIAEGKSTWESVLVIYKPVGVDENGQSKKPVGKDLQKEYKKSKKIYEAAEIAKKNRDKQPWYYFKKKVVVPAVAFVVILVIGGVMEKKTEGSGQK